jgi:hypothetical protein
MAPHRLQWTAGEPVEIRVLGETGGGPYAARMLELSGKRLRVGAAAKIPGGAAVRVDWGGQLVLGQVLQSEPDGFWIEIQHTLLEMDGRNWQKMG